MADPPQSKVFSIFQQRAKLPVASLEVAPPPRPGSSDGPTRVASYATTYTPELRVPTQESVKRRDLVPTASNDSDCITLGSSDDEDVPTSSSLKPISKRKAIGVGTRERARKGKGKAKAIVVDSEDEDEDVVVVKGLTPKKKRSEKGSARSPKRLGDKGKKGKGKLKETESIDLTESPPRKPQPFPASSFGRGSSSTPAFAPLSDVYRQERERRKVNEGVEARWPTAEEHGTLSSTSSRSIERVTMPTPRRYPGSSIEDDTGKGKEISENGDGFFERFARSLDSTDAVSPNPHFHRDLPVASTSTLIPSYPAHPLLDRLADSLTTASMHHTPSPEQSTQSELWTAKYGPKKAAEVLGSVSGESALLLKEWLTELKVAGGIEDEHAKKRRRPVNRGVDKKKKRKKRRSDDLDDFLAGSSEEEGEVGLFDPLMYDDLDEDEPGMPVVPNSSATFHRLTNLVLLVGPNGSGKTVAVQTVAQELGYEIFEVNAGMGKRRAKDLESEVGDVGRNHIVRASPRKPNAKDFFAGFKSAATAKGKMNGNGTEIQNGGPGLRAPTQSLILVEEVDVLYHGEEDFWTGIRILAEESRRPIILTCNDSTLVPVDQLGLQKIHLPSIDSRPEPVDCLSFACPESSATLPYLQLVALTEGHIVTAEEVRRLYEERSLPSPNEAWLNRNQKGERPLPHPFNSTGKPSKDLRKAIMQMQFELQRGRGEKDEGGMVREGEKRGRVGGLGEISIDKAETKDIYEEQGDWLGAAVIATDALSFADAEVSRRVETRIEELDFGAFSTSSDLELGLPLLEPPSSESTQLPYLGREPELAASISSLAYSIYSRAARFTDRADEALESQKLDYVNPLALLSTQFFYDPTLETYHSCIPLLPSPSLVTDYLPIYRAITQADDERERIAEETGEGGENLLEGRGAGVRRSRRVVGGGGKVKVQRRIEWRAKEDGEFVRKSGFV